MEFLIISNTCSEKEFENLQNIKYCDKYSPQQNFFSMLIEGITCLKGNKVVCLTTRAISESNCNIKKLLEKKEIVSDKLEFIYHSSISSNKTRNINNYIKMRKMVNKYLSENKTEDMVALIDPLVVDSAWGALSKLKKHNIKKIAIVTDIPQYVTQIAKSRPSFLGKIKSYFRQKIYEKLMNNMDGFCLLTEDMKIINKNNVPYDIIEGMVSNKDLMMCETRRKNENQIILYAGGLYDKFGIKNLVEAAKKVKYPNFELHLYGEGTSVENIIETNREYPNIKYCGVLPLKQIKIKEGKARFLINPRQTDEEFTKYSFPSKTMEYMSTGRPVISTRLAGIPNEYFKYLYVIEDCSIDGIAETINRCLTLSEDDTNEMGLQGYTFVSAEKNTETQAKKIMELVGRI